jgi:hypothetical protein
LEATAKRKAEGESNRKEELRHYRVSIAAKVILMSQYQWAYIEEAHEIDQDHAGDGVAAELIEGSNSKWLGKGGRHF